MERITRDKAVEWSLSSIVGNIVWIGVSTCAMCIVGSLTGSFQVVFDFASSNAEPAAVWSASLLFIGAVIGALTGTRIALNRVRREKDEALSVKQDEIDGLNERLADALSGKELLDAYEKARLNARGCFRSFTYDEMMVISSIVDTGAIYADPHRPVIAGLNAKGVLGLVPNTAEMDGKLVFDLDSKIRAMIAAHYGIFEEVFEEKKKRIEEREM